MTNHTEQLRKIRDSLASKKKKRIEEEARRSESNKETEKLVIQKTKEGLAIIKKEWKPFLQRVQEEVYETKMFNELINFWGEFPTKFTYETCNWEQEPKAYIPIYAGGIRVGYDLRSEHLLYAIPEGFRFIVGFSNSNSENWRGFEEELSCDTLLRVGKWPDLDILDDMKRSKRGTELVLTTTDLEKLLKYSSPFLLSESTPLYQTGKLKDILNISLERIRREIKDNVKTARNNYTMRVKELLSCLNEAVNEKYKINKED
ncbi:MAG TPA: hypothetical protein VI815_03425 [Candidatus Nanoarchaeia archaeon]|nr:hypothetical protein [Candidatus Nanoarchaeia archaeon]